MNSWWLKFGCFLTGYKYWLIKHCSVASEKMVNKYTSALLLICLIWGGIGYFFTAKYITNTLGAGSFDYKSVLAAITMVFVVIQIERQIMLSFVKNNWARGVRVVIGIVMALIGSIVVDQGLFYKEIKNKKDYLVEIEAAKVLPDKVKAIDSLIANYRGEAQRLNTELGKLSEEPAIISVQKIVSQQKPFPIKLTSGRDTVIVVTSASALPNSEPNPKYLQSEDIRKRINAIETQIHNQYREKIKMRNNIENVYEPGFLDELRAMEMVLFECDSWLPIGVWSLFFVLFFFIELFILVNKMFDTKSDYEYLVQHQMSIRIEQLKAINDTLE